MPFKAACIQINAGREIAPNIETTSDLIRQAADEGAELIVTPENTTMIEPDKEAQRAKTPKEADHPAIAAFSDLARERGIWLVIGSMSMALDDGRAANRSFLFAPDGNIAARYDKIHMFDVDVPDGQTYRESANFRPGEQGVVADLPWGKLGMTICYDLRFAYLYRALAKAGAGILTVPAAFTQFTGKAHWHILLRARAIETGCFVLAPAQTGEHAGGRRTYGHSLIVAPWGEVLADAGEAPGIIYADIDMQRVRDARRMIPALEHDRTFKLPEETRAAGE